MMPGADGTIKATTADAPLQVNGFGRYNFS